MPKAIEYNKMSIVEVISIIVQSMMQLPELTPWIREWIKVDMQKAGKMPLASEPFLFPEKGTGQSQVGHVRGTRDSNIGGMWRKDFKSTGRRTPLWY